jgi:cell division protein FtsZ
LIASSHRTEKPGASALTSLPDKVTQAPPYPAPLEFVDPAETARPASRFIAPPSALSDEKREQLLKGRTGFSRKRLSRLQKELPLEIVFKGRFEKSEPTIRAGEDLDVPTYIRRGVPLN